MPEQVSEIMLLLGFDDDSPHSQTNYQQSINNFQLSYARVKKSARRTRQPPPGLKMPRRRGTPIDGFTPVPSISISMKKDQQIISI